MYVLYPVSRNRMDDVTVEASSLETKSWIATSMIGSLLPLFSQSERSSTTPTKKSSTLRSTWLFPDISLASAISSLRVSFSETTQELNRRIAERQIAARMTELLLMFQ